VQNILDIRNAFDTLVGKAQGKIGENRRREGII